MYIFLELRTLWWPCDGSCATAISKFEFPRNISLSDWQEKLFFPAFLLVLLCVLPAQAAACLCRSSSRPSQAQVEEAPANIKFSDGCKLKAAPTDIKFSDAKEGALVVPRKIKFSNARSSSATLNNAKVTHKFTTAITTFPWSFLGSSHESDSGLLLVRVSLFLLPQSHSGGGVGTGFVSCFHSFLLSAFRCPNEDSTVNPTLPDDVTCRHTGADFLMVSHFP